MIKRKRTNNIGKVSDLFLITITNIIQWFIKEKDMVAKSNDIFILTTTSREIL